MYLSSRVESRNRKHKIGLALAGGGIGGAIYEIGALRALEDAIDGLDFTQVPVYVGVSAGAVVSSCLVNRISTLQLAENILGFGAPEEGFRPEFFNTPAFSRFFKRSLSVPGLVLDAMMDFTLNLPRSSLVGSMSRLVWALPTAIFSNEPLHRYLQSVFSSRGRTNDFRDLDQELYVVASDLDSSEEVVFGTPDWDHVPISRAVQASTALPGLYPPVLIENRHFVDGVLLKTMHASVALDRGVDLLFCLNPIVPVDTARSVEQGFMRRGKLINRGLVTVLSQTIRTLVHSRMSASFSHYKTRYMDADVVLFEPRKDDYTMFFTNIFSFRSRRIVCEHAYDSTLRDLRRRHDELKPMLDRHGLAFRYDVLWDEEQTLWKSIGYDKHGRRTFQPTNQLRTALNRLEWNLKQRLEPEEEPLPAQEPTAPRRVVATTVSRRYNRDMRHPGLDAAAGKDDR